MQRVAVYRSVSCNSDSFVTHILFVTQIVRDAHMTDKSLVRDSYIVRLGWFVTYMLFATRIVRDAHMTDKSLVRGSYIVRLG